MKQLIRLGVFETNSSSAHSLILISKETFDKWKNGELVLVGNPWGYNDDKCFCNTDECKDWSYTYEYYEDEVIRYAYDEYTFDDEEIKYNELGKQGLNQ